MDNLAKYKQAFMDSFNLPEEALASLKYQEVKEWDSVGHMQLMAEIEDAFDIMLETEDIIDFSSFEKGKEILAKYDVSM